MTNKIVLCRTDKRYTEVTEFDGKFILYDEQDLEKLDE